MPHFFIRKKTGRFFFFPLTFNFSRDVSVECFILKRSGVTWERTLPRACLASSVPVDHLRFSSGLLATTTVTVTGRHPIVGLITQHSRRVEWMTSLPVDVGCRRGPSEHCPRV